MDERAEVLKADAARYSAMRAGDLVALEALLADDLTYTHSSALSESKRQYLASLAGGRFRYLETDTQDVTVRLYEKVALMEGRARLRAVVDGVERLLDNRFLSAWTRHAAGWRMSAWASTPIPAAR